MALRAVIDHPKFARLKLLIKANRSTALGYLECLWHFCGRYTPQGNIGKYSATEIEAWLEWEGEEGALIEAFVKAKWLDVHPTHGYVVHDWHKHADDATRMALKRAKLDFLTRPDGEAPEPEKEPETPTPSQPSPDTVAECPYGVATVSGLPEPVPGAVSEPVLSQPSVEGGSAGERETRPELETVTGIPVTEPSKTTPADGERHWQAFSEPMRSVGLILCRANALLDAGPPTERDVKSHLRPNDGARELIDDPEFGIDGGAELYAWTINHKTGNWAWNSVSRNRVQLRYQMRHGIKREPRASSAPVRESMTAQNARLKKAELDRMLAAGEISREEYEFAAA